MISVIIPTHNRADVLKRAICSVQMQSYKDLQIIVVSDGSTDDTKHIVMDLVSVDDRIKFIEYFPAQGGNHARNLGIENADGKYIAFLDDDDEWFADKLTQQIEKIEKDAKIGLVYTGVNIIYEAERLSYFSKPKHRGNLSKQILFGNCISTTSSVLLRREVFEEVGMFDEKLKALQDYDLWIRVCQKYNVEVISEPMLNYYNCIGAKQISSVTQKYIASWDYISNKYAELFDSLSEKENKERKKGEYYDLVFRALRNNEKKLSRVYARKVIKLSFIQGIRLYICTFFKYKTLLKFRRKKK